MWHPPTQQRPEGRSTSIPLIIKCLTTDEKSQTFGFKASSIALWSGQQTVDHTQQFPKFCSTQRTSRLVVVVSTCQQNPFSTDGNTKFRWPSLAASSSSHGQSFFTHQQGQNGFSLATSHWVRAHLEETTKTQTQDQTPQCQMTTMTTSLPSPVNKPQPSSSQTCDRCSPALWGLLVL